MPRQALKGVLVEPPGVCSAERLLTESLPKMARAATNPAFDEVFASHLEETRARSSASSGLFESAASSA